MSAEENKASVRRFIERMNQGDASAVDDFVADDVRYHNAPPGMASGIEGYRQLIGGYLMAFPDLKMTIDDLISEGDKIVMRMTGRGTHKGEFMGIAPTGKTVEAGAITMMQFRDGRLTDEWEQVDALGMMQQLGVIPAPGAAPA